MFDHIGSIASTYKRSRACVPRRSATLKGRPVAGGGSPRNTPALSVSGRMAVYEHSLTALYDRCCPRVWRGTLGLNGSDRNGRPPRGRRNKRSRGATGTGGLGPGTLTTAGGCPEMGAPDESCAQDCSGARISKTSAGLSIMGRSVNSLPCFSRALRALPGENKDPDSRHKRHASKTRPSRTCRSRRSVFAGVEVDEVELALLGLPIVVRRRPWTGDWRRLGACAQVAQDALDGIWLRNVTPRRSPS